jgi:UDP-N-acetylglucosamine 3-dehydrogenase
MKIGVIGLGSMGWNHARIYSNLNYDLVVVDINEELARKASKEFSAEYSNDYKNIKVDAVSIAVPTSLHYEVASYFLNKGVHCLVEKPITKTIEEAEKLIKISKEKNVKLMVGHIERFNPVVRKMKEIIEKEILGKILVINTRRVGPFPLKVIDTGIIVDLAIHDIDVVRYLYEKEPVKVFSKYGRIKHIYEDYAILLLDFGESVASIEVNWFTPHKVRNVVITGTNGIAYMDYIEQSIVIYNSNWKMEPKIEKEEPLKLEIQHFIECIEKNKEPLTSGEEGLKNLKIAYMCLLGDKP